MESRAAVFASRPQAVEVFQAGAWWAGELLGWRHGVDGSCQVRVRVTLSGVEETAWMDLAGLRLPERPLPGGPGPRVADPSSTQKLPRPSSAPRRERPTPVHPAGTASLPVVGGMSAAPTSPRPSGRRRAPEVAETVAASALPGTGGRRRAPEGAETVVAALVPAPRTGGRRRAPETIDGGEVGSGGATPVTAAAGRHRAALPADAGRHRKADTGLVPAVVEPAPVASVARPPVPVTRLDDTVGGRARNVWGSVAEREPELLTRPMRLSDQIPHARRPRLDGSLTGV